ncbi:MAG: hypothetical protein CMM86_09480 [Rhodovulum sp.]|jgi:hypothetical protein|nr:hypothetical protein [Rhodovulum sp.]|tara:strand:- start:1322 stop:1645 length:324 start_codon:yes stop_codon:yes gene_type:complete
MAAKGDTLNIELFQEVITENGGWWSPCSGCHESNEGVPTGEYSAAMQCHRGFGCRECGGLGAVWTEWTAFDEAYHNALKEGRTEQQALDAGSATLIHQYKPHPTTHD